MKNCRECKELKSISDFYPNRAKCKRCYSDQTIAKYQASKEKYREARKLYMREYRKDPVQYTKSIARNRISWALESGKLVKEKCFCGNSKVEAHHHKGYDKDNIFNVVWLCKAHHTEVHH